VKPRRRGPGEWEAQRVKAQSGAWESGSPIVGVKAQRLGLGEREAQREKACSAGGPESGASEVAAASAGPSRAGPGRLEQWEAGRHRPRQHRPHECLREWLQQWTGQLCLHACVRPLLLEVGTGSHSALLLWLQPSNKLVGL